LRYGSAKEQAWLASLPPNEHIPARDEKPELWPENLLPVTVFGRLIMQRQIGMGASAIPVPVIESWARIYEIDDVADLVEKIVAMDAEYLEWAREKADHQKPGPILPEGE